VLLKHANVSYSVEKYRYRLHVKCRCLVVTPAVTGLIKMEEKQLNVDTTALVYFKRMSIQNDEKKRRQTEITRWSCFEIKYQVLNFNLFVIE